ncbi:hypothetical protein PIB30_019930 [Stylosanthes scabra]|uniref:CCHC-type domain-containing protein n=1 Tax=Stylosanthes scabra TaxID=79078 RepID=A0ABU6W6Y6_9FABA|nr:hypothetical protein [Stylosanthes scabra]
MAEPESHPIEGKTISIRFESAEGYKEETSILSGHRSNQIPKPAKRETNPSQRFVRGHLINLQEWTGDESIYDVNHDYMNLWVQMHKIPNYMKEKTANQIGNDLGTVLEIEEPRQNNILLRTFLRVLVEMNIKKPIPTGCCCYCLNCGVLGHNKKQCQYAVAKSTWNPQISRYRPGLGANRAKKLMLVEETATGEEEILDWNDADGPREQPPTHNTSKAVEEPRGATPQNDNGTIMQRVPWDNNLSMNSTIK